MQARQGSGRMVAGLAPVVAVLVLISAVIDVYRVLQRCVRPSRGPPRGLSLATGSGVDEGASPKPQVYRVYTARIQTSVMSMCRRSIDERRKSDCVRRVRFFW